MNKTHMTARIGPFTSLRHAEAARGCSSRASRFVRADFQRNFATAPRIWFREHSGVGISRHRQRNARSHARIYRPGDDASAERDLIPFTMAGATTIPANQNLKRARCSSCSDWPHAWCDDG